MEINEIIGRRSATKETLVPRGGLKKVAIDIVKANIFAIVIMVVAAIPRAWFLTTPLRQAFTS